MNPTKLLDEIKKLVANKDLDGAKKFIEEHKDDLGDYLEQAQALLKGNEAVNDALNKVKGLFGK